MAVGQNSCNCLEDNRFNPTADTYLCLPSVYNPCLEDTDMRYRPPKGTHPAHEFKKGNVPWNKGIIGKMVAWNKGLHGCYTEETIKRKSEAQTGKLGEKAPNWQNGISFEPYCHKFNTELKEKIRERDNRTCQLCNVTENSRKLSIHHIHYDKPNCNPDLIALCVRCNGKVNSNREYWEEYFMNRLKERGLV